MQYRMTDIHGVRITTYESDAATFGALTLIDDLHESRCLGFRAGADYVRHIRPDGARVITSKDGHRWTFRESTTDEVRDWQLELQAVEQRIAELEVHWKAQGNQLATEFLRQGYDDSYSAPEIGLGPLWAEVELVELRPRAEYLRTMLRMHGHAGTQADDTAAARRRALTAARVRRHRSKTRTTESVPTEGESQ